MVVVMVMMHLLGKASTNKDKNTVFVPYQDYILNTTAISKSQHVFMYPSADFIGSTEVPKRYEEFRHAWPLPGSTLHENHSILFLTLLFLRNLK